MFNNNYRKVQYRSKMAGSSFYKICRPLFQNATTAPPEVLSRCTSWLAAHGAALPTSVLCEFVDEICRRRPGSSPGASPSSSRGGPPEFRGGRGAMVKDLVSVGDVLARRYLDLLDSEAIMLKGERRKRVIRKQSDGVFSIESAVTALYGFAQLNIKHRRLADSLEPLIAATPCGFKRVDKLTPFLAVRVISSLALLKIQKCHMLSRTCLDVISTYETSTQVVDKRMKRAFVWSQVAFCSAKLGLRPHEFAPWLPDTLTRFLASPNVGKELKALDVTQLFVAACRLELWDAALACLAFTGRCLRGNQQDIAMMCQAFSTFYAIRTDGKYLSSMAVFLDASLKHFCRSSPANVRQFISLPATLLLLSEEKSLSAVRLSVLHNLNETLSASSNKMQPATCDDSLFYAEDFAGGTAPSRLQDDVSLSLQTISQSPSAPAGVSNVRCEVSALLYSMDFVLENAKTPQTAPIYQRSTHDTSSRRERDPFRRTFDSGARESRECFI